MVYYWRLVADWVVHNLWIVVIPFTKVIIKKLIAIKFFALLKALALLAWHFGKLLLLKIFKTLGVRYGVFFSQARWYWVRWLKVMFLRRGKQFFRALTRFWQGYSPAQRWVIILAFFPIVILLFFMGLSFNVTRKTMVQRAQESALFEVANSAHRANRGVRARVRQLDKWLLKKIRESSPKNNQPN